MSLADLKIQERAASDKPPPSAVAAEQFANDVEALLGEMDELRGAILEKATMPPVPFPPKVQKKLDQMRAALQSVVDAAYELGLQDPEPDPTATIAAICDFVNKDGPVFNPRIVNRADFDLSRFTEQESDVPGIAIEFVDQRGPGMAGDDFHGTLAYPIGDRLFLIDFES